MKIQKSKVKLVGNKKDGYVLTVSDNLGYKYDMALLEEELEEIYTILKRKYK